MEDFIYIILAIVWLVISVIGSRKKKQQQQQQQPTSPKPVEKDYEVLGPEPTSSKRSEFEDMLEDFFGTGTTAPKPQPVAEADHPGQEKDIFAEREFAYESLETTDMDQLKDYQGKFSVGDDYEFSAEGKVETLEDLIKSYAMSDEKAMEEDSKIAVVDLDETGIPGKTFEFDARNAIIYAEIINRKYS